MNFGMDVRFSYFYKGTSRPQRRSGFRQKYRMLRLKLTAALGSKQTFAADCSKVHFAANHQLIVQ